MKKSLLLSSVVILFVLIFGSLTVQADLIYEPSGNAFYKSHRSEMKHEDHIYEANAPGGALTLYESPVSTKVLATVPNETAMNGSYSWVAENSIRWVILSYYDGTTHIDGWAPMDYVWRRYDTELFEQDYAGNIEEKNGSVTLPKETEKLVLYAYPGSEVYATPGVSNDENVGYYLVYTDENGAKWGKIGYFYGMKQVWFSLDNPSETVEPKSMDTRKKPAPGEIVSDSGEPVGKVETETIKPIPENDQTLLLVGILVGAVVLLSAGALILFKVLGKKKKQTES